MKNLRTHGKKLVGVIASLLLVVSLVACGNSNDKVVKIGLNGTSSLQWEHVKEEAAKEGIKLELVYFADYVQPNRALVDGELDLNAFQTVSFLNAFNKENKDAIRPIGTTYLAPMGIFSTKITSLTDVKEGGKVTIPNDISNQGRALKLLETAKLIKLKAGAGDYATPDDVVENPKKLEIIPMAANQLPPTLGDAEIAVINNGVAVDAGYPLEKALFHEDDLAISYLNVIASRTADKDNETYKRIVELFQTDEVKEIIIADTKGNTVPTFVSLDKIGF